MWRSAVIAYSLMQILLLFGLVFFSQFVSLSLSFSLCVCFSFSVPFCHFVNKCACVWYEDRERNFMRFISFGFGLVFRLSVCCAVQCCAQLSSFREWKRQNVVEPLKDETESVSRERCIKKKKSFRTQIF